MERDEDNQDQPVFHLKSKYQNVKPLQSPAASSLNYKLDIAKQEEHSDNLPQQKFNIFQKQIIDRLAKPVKKEKLRMSTLSPSQEKEFIKQYRTDNSEMRAISMQSRPELQELLSPLNYYFQRKDQTHSAMQYVKSHSPDNSEKKHRHSQKRQHNQKGKREEKNQQIYEQIYEILKKPETQISQKQRRMYLHNYYEDNKLDSFLNNTPLNLSNIKPLELDTLKSQIQSTKSQSSAAAVAIGTSSQNTYLNEALLSSKNSRIQSRAITSLNEAPQKGEARLRLFSRKSREQEIPQSSQSPKDVQKSTPSQTVIDGLQTRKFLSVFKHRQIYSRSMHRREELFKNGDDFSQPSKVNKTLEPELIQSEQQERVPFYTLEEDSTADFKLNSVNTGNNILSLLGRKQKEILPIRQLESRQNKQAEDKSNNLKGFTEAKKRENHLSNLSKLDIDQIQFDQQFITLANNHSVKFSKEALKKVNYTIDNVEYTPKNCTQFKQPKSKSNQVSIEGENMLNILQKIKITKNQHSSSLNPKDKSSTIQESLQTTYYNNNNAINYSSNQIQKSMVENSLPTSPTAVKIKKEQIVRKYIKDMITQNNIEHLSQDIIKNDDSYIQQVVDKYSYKKMIQNTQKLRQRSLENQQKPSSKKPIRVFDLPDNKTPGPGQYNISSMIGEKWNQTKRNQQQAQSKVSIMNDEPNFFLVPHKQQTQQFLITNYFSPKGNSTISDIQQDYSNLITHANLKQNYNNTTISYV